MSLIIPSLQSIFSTYLKVVYSSDGNLADQSNKWFNSLKGEFHKSFRKFRYNGRQKVTKMSELLDERRNI